MSIYVISGLPVAQELRQKGLDVREGRPEPGKKCLRILFLNLMINAEESERCTIEKLCLPGLDIELTLLHTASYQYKRGVEHYCRYYLTLDQVREEYFDGMIINGAPMIPGSEVAFWEEYQEIERWSRSHARSGLHICWGAAAAVYHRYQAEFVYYDEKFLGVHPAEIVRPEEPIFHGMKQGFPGISSREIGFDPEYIKAREAKGLLILAQTPKNGPTLMKTADSQAIYSLLHFDYDADRLHIEYLRDREKDPDTLIPHGYYVDDNPSKPYQDYFMENQHLFFANWLRYYVQEK